MKKLYPEQPLGLICRKGLGLTLKNLGLVDYVWEIQKGNSQSYRDILKDLKKQFKVDLLVSAHTSFRTTLFCARIKANKKITFAKPWNFLVFDEREKWPGYYPEALRLLTLLRHHSIELNKLFKELPEPENFTTKDSWGRLESPPEWSDPNQGWKPQDTTLLEEKFGLKDKKWIALFPGSVWATKMWKKEGYIQLGQELQKKNYQIVVMGGPEEKTLGQLVADAIPNAMNLCGQTPLIESLTLLSKATLVVGNDSSSSHMAALVGVPIVCIYGPTVLKFGYRPWAQHTAAVEFEDLECRPCSSHGPMKCPLNHHDCMQKLETSKVLKAVQTMLGE